jgi:hypothetical protein
LASSDCSFVYSHFYIILILFLLSFSFSMLALRHPRWFPFTLAALLHRLPDAGDGVFSCSNCCARCSSGWCWASKPCPGASAWRAPRCWLPYLILLIGAMLWRSLLFGFQTYQPTLMSRLRAAPLPALLGLLQTA